jgi:prepilin-type N-terminal cleavage/methylation domain-containing protein
MKVALNTCFGIRRDQRAFTFPEMLIATALSTMVMAAAMVTHLFGLRLMNVTSSKIVESQSARKALNLLREEVRSAQTLFVGTGTSTSFTNLPPNSPREGNALQFSPTDSTNYLIRYFADPASQTLKRMVLSAGSPVAVQIIAANLTNQFPFCAQTCTGAVMTNDQNARLLQITLNFSRWTLPPSGAGSAASLDGYRVQTRIARRPL